MNSSREVFLAERAKRRPKWHIPAGILSLIFAAATIEVWAEDSPADENFAIWLFAYLVALGLFLWPLFHAVRWRVRQKSAIKISRKLSQYKGQAIQLNMLDRVLGEKNAENRITGLLKIGFLQRMEIEHGMLVLDNQVEHAAREAEQPENAATESPDPIIAQIRYLNDEIDDEAVSRRIDRLEQVTASILKTLQERPDRAEDARRFMNYYLPTTLKLLESYRLMEKQTYQGENIKASRHQIEEALEKLVAATEKQQDKLFRSEALDVEAEISVLETMMASDGLVIDDRIMK